MRYNKVYNVIAVFLQKKIVADEARPFLKNVQVALI